MSYVCLYQKLYKKYIKLEMEIVEFEVEDIITQSSTDDGDEDP